VWCCVPGSGRRQQRVDPLPSPGYQDAHDARPQLSQYYRFDIASRSDGVFNATGKSAWNRDAIKQRNTSFTKAEKGIAVRAQ
jgi:hypothetical protein